MNLLALGAMMGVAFAAPPGIVTAETLRRGLARGFRAALSVQLGSLVGDVVYAALALAGLAVVVQNPVAQRVLGVAGTLYILYHAVTSIWRVLRAPAPTGAADLRPAPHRNAFFSGAALSLTNPWAIGYWVGPGGALAASGATDSAGSALIFFLSCFSACLVYGCTVAWLVGRSHRGFSNRAGRVISLACSLLMLLLGLGIGTRVLVLLLAGP